MWQIFFFIPILTSDGHFVEQLARTEQQEKVVGMELVRLATAQTEGRRAAA